MDQAHDGVRQGDGWRVSPTGGGRVAASWVAGLLVVAALGASAGPVQGQRTSSLDAAAGARGAKDCLGCHALANLGYRESATGPVRRFTVSPKVFHSSAHGKLSCRQCHTDFDAFPHIASSQRLHVTCEQDCHAVDSVGRPYTHRAIAAQFRESVHGRPARPGRAGAAAPDPDAPSCLTCHSGDAHAITPPPKMTRAAKMAVCVGCHDNRALMEKHGVSLEAVASYRRSFHYKAIRFGGSGTAICIDCHTAHHILPPTDARSSVAPATLTRTCGQAGCHRGAGRNFSVSGANHLDLRIGREPVLWFEEKFFLVLTAGTMLMLLVGIVLDVQRKFGWAVLLGRLARVLRRWVDRLRPSLAASGRRTLRVARRILLD